MLIAKCNWHGQEFTAEPIEQRADGSWRMRARDKHPRFAVGTDIIVHPSEIVSLQTEDEPDGQQAATPAAEASAERT